MPAAASACSARFLALRERFDPALRPRLVVGTPSAGFWWTMMPRQHTRYVVERPPGPGAQTLAGHLPSPSEVTSDT